MVNLELLHKTIEDSDIPFTRLCRRAGIEKATLYNRMKGKGEFKVSEITGLVSALNLDKDVAERIFFAN